MQGVMVRRVACWALIGSLVAASTWNERAAAANAREDVLYRLEAWKTKHIHDAAKADTISQTLTKLGCEVQRGEHDGHVDLKYRCPQWKKLSLKSHDEAHKWEKWLKEYGFQTQHHH